MNATQKGSTKLTAQKQFKLRLQIATTKPEYELNTGILRRECQYWWDQWSLLIFASGKTRLKITQWNSKLQYSSLRSRWQCQRIYHKTMDKREQQNNSLPTMTSKTIYSQIEESATGISNICDQIHTRIIDSRLKNEAKLAQIREEHGGTPAQPRHKRVV